MILYEDKCEEYDLDPKRVQALARRLEKLGKEAQAMRLTIFGGSGSGSLRYHGSGSVGAQTIVADVAGANFDGGDGGDFF